MKVTLPTPNASEQAHSAQLCEYIAQQIQYAGGNIVFAKFMELALYTPGLGYYHSNRLVFGRDGDFVTAPEISPLFAQSIGNAIESLLKVHPQVLELGAGSGKLAATLLTHCSQIEDYAILEPSAALQQLQRQTLAACCPQAMAKVRWLSQLPDAFCGLILANEVMDALPAMRFYRHGSKIEEYAVSAKNQAFAWELIPVQDQALQEKISQLSLPDIPYHSEMQPWLQPWIKSLSDCLKSGAILLFDYGFPRHELYHPQRHQGTLMCHYRHRAHDDPFFYPGLQDITVHVDFTAAAEAAAAVGLDVAGYTSQAAFLFENNILTLAQDNRQAHQQIKILTLPQEMGELFKAILFTRDDIPPITGFQLQDRRHRL